MILKKFPTTILLALTLCCSSCMNDLDIMQDNKLSASNMWTEEKDATSAAYGLYYYLRSAFSDRIIYWGEYRNGLWGAGTHGTLINNEMAAVATSTMSATNTYADWSGLYTTINQANLILKHVPKMSLSDENKNFAMGNAYYIRAICYFWIARIWGDAPLCLDGYESTTQDMYLPRSPKSELYKQVETDIVNAAGYVKNSMVDKTTVTPAALAMLKTDYALWMYTNQNAGEGYLTMAEDAISSMNLTGSELQSDYAAIFSSRSKLGKEVIWAIHKDQSEAVNGFSLYQMWGSNYIASQYVNNPVPVTSSNQWWLYTERYIRLITEDPSDIRADVSYGHGAYGTGGADVGWANKFVGQVISNTRVLDSDLILYRYAQAYLFDAEIKYYRKQYAQALHSLGVVTNRAYGNAGYYQDATPKAVLDAIVKENLKEFTSEYNTWWMLIRTNKCWDYNENLAQLKDKQNILLWPITQGALNRNHNLKQTEGWIGQ